MLVNVTFSILFVIYSITVNFSVYDATREALSDKNHFIRTSYHLNGDGTISRSAIVRNFLTLTDFNVLNYNFNFENEKPYDISVSDQLKDYYILSNEKERSY
jgi:hypothetical protein